PVRPQLSDPLVSVISDINIAVSIDRDSVWFLKLSIARAFCSYACNERAACCELLDPGVAAIGNQHIAGSINSNSERVIKLSLSRSPTSFKHVRGMFR